MTDIFVSYARADELHAQRVTEALRADGFRVWRDEDLPAHRPYAEVIEERLNSAKAVIVIWSAESAKSHWVRAEADSARTAGTLVQATLDGCLPPLPFNQIHCADLSSWDGESPAPGWVKLKDSLTALAGAPASAAKAKKRPALHQICVCVLPFANMSGDAEQEYFSDGISEDITTDLSKISSLGVTARNTAFTFKGRAVHVCEVAQQLGVTHVLEGSVRKVGDRVRINAQLIDGATGEHVWAERYDRDLTDIFAIQDEISHSIVRALKLKLMPAERKAIEQRGTTNADAYKLYLLARQYWVTGNHGDIKREERVMRIASKAVELDPYYAQAWALLGLAQSNLRYGFRSEVEDGVAAAHTALAIDASIAEAHCPMVRRLEQRGLHDDAAAALQKALELDPDSWEVNKEAARVRIRERRIEDATGHYLKAVSVMETDLHAWGWLVTCYHALGDSAAEREAAEMAVARAEQVLSQDPSNGAALSFGARGLAVLGKVDNAREWMDRAMLVDFDNLDMRFNFARMLAAQLGDIDGALKLLQRNFSSIDAYMLKLADADPDLDALRGDSRFVNMVARARSRLGIKDDDGLAAMLGASSASHPAGLQ
jgi:adenylate cyclase